LLEIALLLMDHCSSHITSVVIDLSNGWMKWFRIQRLLSLGDVMLDGEIKKMVLVAEGTEILEGDHRTVFTAFHLKLW
jgi:hypothetical protein